MTLTRTLSVGLTAAAALCLAVAAPACDDKVATTDATATPEEPKPEEPKPEEPKPEEPKPEEPKPEEPKPAADAQHITFDVAHHDPAKGIVNGRFETFKVVSGNTDLSKPATATATIEIDLASVQTGNPKRDGHVKSPDFFDVAKFAKATVVVKGVAAAEAEGTYTATASVSLHGVSKDLPVTFKVIDKREDGSLLIEGQHTGLVRADFGIGGAPEKTNVAPTLENVKMRLVIPNTAK